MTRKERLPLLSAALICIALALLLLAACVASVSASCEGYVVQPGEGTWRIAYNHGETLGQLLVDNSLTSASVIHPGDCLRVGGQATALPIGLNQIPTALSRNSISLSGVTFGVLPIGVADTYMPWDANWHELVWSSGQTSNVFIAHVDRAGAYLAGLPTSAPIDVTLAGQTTRYLVTDNTSYVTNWFATSGTWFYQHDIVRLFTCWYKGGVLVGRTIVVAEAVR